MRSPVSIPPRPDDLGLTLRGWAADALPTRPTPRRAATAIALAAGTLALATLLALALESGDIGIEDASPVYLLAVVAVGSQFGTWAAIGTALIAFLAYDLLLTQPRLSLVVSDPREWLDLLLFLFVAIAIGRLVAIQHSRAEEADARAREASSLFAMSRLLATADSADQAAPELARRLAADAELQRVWIAVGEHARQRTVADTGAGAPIPASAVVTTLVRTPGDEPARWVRTHEPGRGREPTSSDGQVLRVRIEAASGDGSSANSVLGSIGALRNRSSGPPTRAETRILALAADQIALSLRRDQLRREATDAEIARQGDALKTALIDSVSHDLRTPLASIRATAGSLMDPAVPWSEEPARAAARVIDDEAARLDHLVRAVLDLSRIEAGALRPELVPYDIRDLLEPVVARARAAAPERAIGTSLPDDLPAVLVDPVLADVVLVNLLDNALAHTASPAPVQVTAARVEDDRVRLVVDDGGAGVPREALPLLFERFYRVPGDAGGARKGLGIGLSIVRGLVEAMGGAVQASRSPLGGLAIAVTLVVADIPDEASEP